MLQLTVVSVLVWTVFLSLAWGGTILPFFGCWSEAGRMASQKSHNAWIDISLLAWLVLFQTFLLDWGRICLLVDSVWCSVLASHGIYVIDLVNNHPSVDGNEQIRQRLVKASSIGIRPPLWNRVAMYYLTFFAWLQYKTWSWLFDFVTKKAMPKGSWLFDLWRRQLPIDCRACFTCRLVAPRLKWVSCLLLWHSITYLSIWRKEDAKTKDWCGTRGEKEDGVY